MAATCAVAGRLTDQKLVYYAEWKQSSKTSSRQKWCAVLVYRLVCQPVTLESRVRLPGAASKNRHPVQIRIVSFFWAPLRILHKPFCARRVDYLSPRSPAPRHSPFNRFYRASLTWPSRMLRGPGPLRIGDKKSHPHGRGTAARSFKDPHHCRAAATPLLAKSRKHVTSAFC